MPEIGTSGLMSGDGKRGDGQGPQATAPILDSTAADIGPSLRTTRHALIGRRIAAASEIVDLTRMQEKTREEISVSTTRDGLTKKAVGLERAKQSRDNNHAERHAKKPKNHGHMKLL
jgi:hypothetical protein